jgi:hypothetical protein
LVNSKEAGCRMQISRPLSPKVGTGTGKGMDGESGPEMKSETGERIEKGRAERMAGTVDGDFVSGDSVSFCSEVSGAEVFCFDCWSVALTAGGFYCSIGRTRNYSRSPRRGCNS